MYGVGTIIILLSACLNVGNCITSDEVQCPLDSVTIQCRPQLACICDEGTQSPFCIGKCQLNYAACIFYGCFTNTILITFLSQHFSLWSLQSKCKLRYMTTVLYKNLMKQYFFFKQ